MKIFAKLAKYDETTGYFEAIATDESLDKAGEIMDYESSKPNFIKWSETITKASDGKSAGNVRAMHGKVAAGKLSQMICDDEAKAIKVAGFVVDDNEKKKMASGVYTGVSIGGSYAKRWEDPVIKGAFRYEALPSEISIVDYPCNGNSFFTVVKSDGAEELRKFETTTDNTEALAKWAEGLTEGERAAVLAKIAPAQDDETKGGADNGEPAAKDYTAQAERLSKHADAESTGNVILAVLGKPTIEKGLWTVSSFAEVLQSLANITESSEQESAWEGDDSKVPAQLRAALKPLAEAFLAMAAEEVAEATKGEPDPDDALALAAGGDLAKAGARHSAKDKAAIKALAKHHAAAKKHLAAMDDHMVSLNSAPAKPDADADDAQKLAKVANDLQKVVAERDELAGKLEKVTAQYAELLTKAAPPKGSLRAVSKDADASDAPLNKIDDSPVLNKDGSIDHAETALKMMKIVHKR